MNEEPSRWPEHGTRRALECKIASWLSRPFPAFDFHGAGFLGSTNQGADKKDIFSSTFEGAIDWIGWFFGSCWLLQSTVQCALIAQPQLRRGVACGLPHPEGGGGGGVFHSDELHLLTSAPIFRRAEGKR